MEGLPLASRFDRERPRLRAVAYRMLGSLTEADDAVQEAWLRLQRIGADEIESLQGWLTTVVARICLNMLRARSNQAEQPLNGFVAEPLVSPAAGEDPEYEALLSEAVGVALQVVLDTLGPAERVAFVLHDMFAVPFDEIAVLVGRSPGATRQLTSRARRRVQESAPAPDQDIRAQRSVVDAFFAATREGDLGALVAVLDPDVVIRNHQRERVVELRGAEQAARGALPFARFAPYVRPALINGAAGVVAYDGDQPFALLAFTVRHKRAIAIDIFTDRQLVPKLVRHTALVRPTGAVPPGTQPSWRATGRLAHPVGQFEPLLFDHSGHSWQGERPEEVRSQVWPLPSCHFEAPSSAGDHE